MNKFIQVAREAAERAGEFLKRNITKARIVGEKSGAVDIVTDADIEAQKMIVSLVRKNFPNHGILAEESEQDLRTLSNGIPNPPAGGRDDNWFSASCHAEDDYLWAIDPIDGTSAYSIGLPTYSSSIALLKERKPIVGAIYLALIDEVVLAEKEKGVFTGKKKLFVSTKTNLRQAAVGFDPAYFNREIGMRIASSLSDEILILPMLWSQATALALVAKGVLDGYIQCGNPKVWDVAAGKLLVEEAGGVVTTFSGESLDIFNVNGYVAGNPSIHQQLLKFVGRSVKQTPSL